LPRPKKSFSPEFKEEAVKMVIETSHPIARLAKELGINEGTISTRGHKQPLPRPQKRTEWDQNPVSLEVGTEGHHGVTNLHRHNSQALSWAQAIDARPSFGTCSSPINLFEVQDAN
jgi:hypothetical protein